MKLETPPTKKGNHGALHGRIFGWVMWKSQERAGALLR